MHISALLRNRVKMQPAELSRTFRPSFWPLRLCTANEGSSRCAPALLHQLRGKSTPVLFNGKRFVDVLVLWSE